ncbi:hypothetical protein SAMN05428974_1307 [Sphingopyxis sp. YR583]|uniref:DUF6161 domain-containing protein n=1 Tax=Sphingopyxis sp. YR583 TaxID=1881047 RepID=UPI0008A7A2D2|nr:DUF6161 domain-containing protein [Sphingopyxis sp. YR583]SEH14928.1 hypothetical protein SAMN05428974_1307 [Sphingopyxis sp. YR583]
MSEPFFTVNLSGQDPLIFMSRQQFSRWFHEEHALWNWLWLDEAGEYLQSTPPELRTIYKAFSGGGTIVDDMSEQGLASLRTWQNNHLPGSETNLFVSASARGRRVLSIKERVGIAEARIAYRYLRSPGEWQQFMADPTTLRGMLLAADPGAIEPTGLIQQLEQERTNYRSAITRMENRVRELEQQKRDREASRARRVRGVVHRLRRAAQSKSDAIIDHFATTSQAAIARITETEDRFRTQMELAAPVDYWKAKSADHGAAERLLLKVTVGYFLAAAIIIGGAGYLAATIILSLEAGVDRTPVYLITSGALLAITTLVFWIGRLVVKLWLSEHHLRVDAKERAIMTQAYLAMNENGNMAETDRAIMLASIFRPAPDGVVKEEGPQDIGLQAILSRLLVK